jgi:hypothetical protein
MRRVSHGATHPWPVGIKGKAPQDLGGGPRNLRRQDLTGRHGFVTYLFGRGAVAQLEEHLNGIQGVRGSNPLSSTKFWQLLRQVTGYHPELAFSILGQRAHNVHNF